jgi:osmotically-inducible protein OsmY
MTVRHLFSCPALSAALAACVVLATGLSSRAEGPEQNPEQAKAEQTEQDTAADEGSSGSESGKSPEETKEITDRSIMLAVQTELILDDAVPAHRVEVEVEDGVVELSGSVDSFSGKLAAEEAAEKTKGVIAVVNRIDVEPAKRSDGEIRADAVAKLARDPAAEAWQISVQVNEGEVTLTGEVDSFSERLLAEEIVQGVPGVRDVHNMLTYEVEEDRPDHEIRDDVIGRLKADASVDAGMIDVRVDDGEVSLSGSVGSAWEKTIAETDAQMVAGVESVDTGDLEVQWWLRDEMADVDLQRTDEETKEAVETAMLYNPRVMSFNVQVTVADGVATLTGVVDNLQAKMAAENEAENTLGVWRVKNFLRVRPTSDRPDEEIAEDVRRQLREDPYVDRYDINAHVYNGKVFLGGEVDSWFMRNQAEELAAAVPGVIDVHNGLTVDYNVPTRSDLALKDDIQSQLWWSPFVDSDDLNVTVVDQVATLTGTVEDWDEREAAIENAYEGGARRVVDRLEVESIPEISAR